MIVTFPATEYEVLVWRDASEAQAAETKIEQMSEAYGVSAAQAQAATLSSKNVVYYTRNQNQPTDTSLAAFAACLPS